MNKTVTRDEIHSAYYSNNNATKLEDLALKILTERDEAIREVERLRSEVREWLCIKCRTIYPGPPRTGISCVVCPKCEGDTGPRLHMELREEKRQMAAYREGWANLWWEEQGTPHFNWKKP